MGVICERNISTKLKDKVYKTAINPAMVYGAECWAVRKNEERKLKTMMRAHVAVGKKKDKTRSCEKCRHLWKEAHEHPMAEFLREKR